MYQIVLFTIVCVLSLVLNLHCVVHSISVCVWAPGLALRGASADAMIRAVEGMKDERIRAFQVRYRDIAMFISPFYSSPIYWHRLDLLA